MTDALLRIRDLRVRFPGAAADAVSGLDLDLAQGEALALVGVSGCGKTATVRAITGLHPPGTQVGGSVLWRGIDLRTLAGADLRRRLGAEIATVFQDAGASLNPVVRVGDQLVELIRLHGKADRKSEGGLRDALFGEVRLDAALARRYPHQLSGGEQQRVALALALAGDPELLIADEPTTALDPGVQQEIVVLLNALAERRSMALLFITHDLGLAGRVAERVAVMAGGVIVEQGILAEVVAAPESEAARELVTACSAAPGAAGRGDTECATAPPADGLVVENLVVHRRGAARPALNGLNFRLARGEAFGLVGASGSGKTTLARALAGFLESSGRVVPPPCGRAGPRPIQMIFQSPASALDPRRDILTSVGDAAAAAGSADPGKEARGLLREVGFPAGMEFRRPHALSGGQRQRAVIARVLAAKPDVIVADEPASSLDLPARQDLVDVLDRIRALRGIVLVLISHDLRLVRRCCGRVGVLDAGELVEIVPAGERPESAVGREIWLASSSFPSGPPGSRPQPCE